MLILKLAYRNLLRHTKKTALLGTLIAAGMMFLFAANAVFESTRQGLESSFVKSLTGDAVIGAETENLLSLFGNETPIIGEYEIIPAIAEYPAISREFETLRFTQAWTPVVAAAAYLEIGDFRHAVPVFGIDPHTYFSVCSDIDVLSGDTGAIKNGGIFINSMLLEKIEKALGKPLETGEEIKLSMYSDGSFRIRKGHFAGVHSYVSYTQPLDRVVLADPVIVRSLANYTLGYALEDKDVNAGQTVSEDTFDMDDLFSGGSDIVEAPKEEISIEYIETALEDTGERDSLVMTESAAWSFLLFKAKENEAKNLMKELEAAAEKKGSGIRVLDWKAAAGLSAQAVFALQAAFNIGMIFIIIGAILVIMNALVISVLERSSEIGTMRAVGAGKGFIRKLFIAESMILVMISAAAGIAAGVIISYAVSRNGIVLDNDLLITLFGGRIIKPFVSLRGVLTHFLGAAVVGAVSWVYPVSIAIKIQPVTIMGRD